MKKTITTILILLYLTSSVGFVSVQHLCHMNQMDDLDCCTTTHQISPMACCAENTSSTESSCCADVDHNRVPIHTDDEITFIQDGVCCEVLGQFNKINTSTISQPAKEAESQG